MSGAAEASGREHNRGNVRTHGNISHLYTPPEAMEAMREPAAGVDLMQRHHLYRYDADSRRTLRRGLSHFLSPQLQVLVKEKPRIVQAEKAEFAELLSEEPSGRPIQELSLDLMRRSFMIRRRVAAGPNALNNQDDDGRQDGTHDRPAVDPDVPIAEQTTNKLSPAFAKKNAKRARPEGANAAPSNFKSSVRSLITDLMAMKWEGWNNPFSVVLRKNTAPPRYFDIIKRPMNLIFIRDNLNKNKYATVAEVEADLDLLVDNALTFNRPIDPVHQQALELQAEYRRRMPRLKQDVEGFEEQEEGQIEKKSRVR